MKITKKIFSLLIVMFLLVATVTNPVAAKEEISQYSEEIKIIKAFGIMNGDEEGNFNAEDNLTRAEFAQVLSILLQINDDDVAQENAWYFKFWEDSRNDEIIPADSVPMETEKVQISNTPKFTDVDSNHWAFNVINKITDIGYMIGVSSSEFAPDEYVTINQVNKVLVKILGYEAFAEKYGSYPAGYNYVASSIKLLKGINHYGDTPVLRGELAKMIYNMFEAEMVGISHITDEGVTTYQKSDKTFLEDKLGIKKHEAKLTSTSVSEIYNRDTTDKGEVVAGDVTYKVAEGVEYINNFLGQNIEFYTVEAQSGNLRVIIYATLADEADEFVIDIKDFVGFTNDGIKYMENDDEEILNTATLPVIIVNSVVSDSVSDSTIKAFSNGTVKASKSNNSKEYDLITITGYNSVYVKNKAEYRVVNGLSEHGSGALSMLNLDPVENKNVAITYIKDGMPASIDSITNKSVLDVAKSDKTIEIIISDEKINVKLNGISVEDDATYLFDDNGNSYIVSRDYAKSTIASLPEIGEKTTLYFNSFGEVAYAESESAEYENVGIYIRADSDTRGLNGRKKLKIYTAQAYMETLPLADKITFTNSNDETRKLNQTELVNILTGCEETLITYTINDDNQITAIKQPLSFENNRNRVSGRMGVFYETKIDSFLKNSGYDNKAYVTGNTRVFLISNSTEVDEEIKYSIVGSASLSDEAAYPMTRMFAYNTEKDSPEADYIVGHTDSVVSYKAAIRTVEMFVVTKVLEILNYEGEPAVQVEGYFIDGASDVAGKTKIFESSTGAFYNMHAFINPDENVKYSVKNGDIIRLFEVNSEVVYASLVYRNDLNYKNNPRVRTGALAGLTDSLAGEKGDGNPTAFNFEGEHFMVGPYKITPLRSRGLDDAIKVHTTTRIMHMFPVRLYGTYFTFTNQDLSDPSQIYDPVNEKYLTYSMVVPKNITVITYKNGKCTVKAGDVTDIKTYEDSFDKCSDIIVQTYNGKVDKMFVINRD